MVRPLYDSPLTPDHSSLVFGGDNCSGGNSLMPSSSAAYNATVPFPASQRRRAMRAKGANGVGRFSVEFEIANNDDLVRAKYGDLPPDKVRRQRIPGVVDSGAAKL